MRRSLAVLGLLAILVLGAFETRGQCPSFTLSSCGTPGTQRVCHRDGTITTAVACTNVAVVGPATAFMLETSGPSTFIMASCTGPGGSTAGNCAFQNCGICGTFSVDMVNGMPVELMDFGFEDEEDSEDADRGGEAAGGR